MEMDEMNMLLVFNKGITQVFVWKSEMEDIEYMYWKTWFWAHEEMCIILSLNSLFSLRWLEY
jgi:hypothetical protein